MTAGLPTQTFIEKLVRQAGTLALQHQRGEFGVAAKSNPGDLVTTADKAVSEFLVNTIHREYPSHAVHSEEMAQDINPGAEVEWVLDPIDGTRSFAGKQAHWCVMAAVLCAGELVSSAIYHPAADVLFMAEKGKGATRNAQPVRARRVESLSYALGVWALDGVGVYKERAIGGLSRFLSENNGWVQNDLSMMPFCYVASGGTDFGVINCGFDHDYLAVTLIGREAGATVCDFDGNKWRRGRQDYVLVSPGLEEAVLRLLL